MSLFLNKKRELESIPNGAVLTTYGYRILCEECSKPYKSNKDCKKCVLVKRD